MNDVMSNAFLAAGDLAQTDSGETVLIVDIKPAHEIYEQFYDTDDEHMHVWLGGDVTIAYDDLMWQICSQSGLQWMRWEDLRPFSDLRRAL